MVCHPTLKFDDRAPKLKVAIVKNVIKMGVLYVQLRFEQFYSSSILTGNLDIVWQIICLSRAYRGFVMAR